MKEEVIRTLSATRSEFVLVGKEGPAKTVSGDVYSLPSNKGRRSLTRSRASYTSTSWVSSAKLRPETSDSLHSSFGTERRDGERGRTGTGRSNGEVPS